MSSLAPTSATRSNASRRGRWAVSWVAHRYWVLPVGLVGVMLVLFLAVEALDVEMLTDPRPTLSGSRPLAAMAGVSLLVADVVLPVPSSGVMLVHGALFGVALGSALSLLGSLGAFAVAFALGRRGTGIVARIVEEDERRRADRLLRRWGAVAIIVTRPVPMLAETTAFVAGASSLPWRPAVGAALVGSLPGSVLYSVAGAAAATFTTGAVVFCAVLVFGLGVALLARRRRPTPRGATDR